MNNFIIIWFIILSISLIIMWILTYFLYFKAKGLDKRCNKKIEGVVKGYSFKTIGDFHLPLVKYIVNNKEYKVAGPKFKSGKVLYISTPFIKETEYETNLTSRDNLPDKLIVGIKKNSFASIMQSPLKDLYPIGQKVNVYYNENNPKEAYIDRYVEPSKIMLVFTIFTTIVCTALLIFLFVYVK